MYIDFTVIDDLFFSSSTTQPNELGKAKEIQEQLKYSIEWLTFQANKETRYQEKSDLLKEITAASRELDRLTKEINKVELINEQ